MIRPFFIALFFGIASISHAAIDPGLIAQLAAEESDDKIAAIQAIAQSEEPDAAKTLQALADGELLGPDGYEIMLNNRIRAELANALAGLRLLDADPEVRLAAAKELQSNVGIEMAPQLNRALAREKSGEIKALLLAALAQANLASTDAGVRLSAVKSLGNYVIRTSKIRF